MAGKSPTKKRIAAKSTLAKAPATNSAPKVTVAKKAKAPPPASKKGPIALRKPAPRKPAATEPGTYYIVVEHEDVRIATAKPQSTGRVETATSFIEAKEKAVDRLIDIIDRFERRLWQVKQSQDHETLVDRG
jgi:hypothetical protein